MLRAGAGQGASSFLTDHAFVGLCLDDLIATGSCFTLGADLVRRGFQPMGRDYPPNYRNNDRLIFDDPALAAELWTIAAPRLPHELTFEGVTWRAVALNPRFRACRYAHGQSFTVHRDGAHAHAGRRSWLTLQIYLNDAAAFTGGRTRFYSDVHETTPAAAVEARAGRAIVFDHRAWHDGEAVTRGTKIVLRTDVMFERVAPPDDPGESAALTDASVIGRHEGYVWRVLERQNGRLASSGRDGCVREWGASDHALGRGSVTALCEDAHRRLWAGTRSGRLECLGTPLAIDCGAAVLDLAAGTRGGIAAALASVTVATAPAPGQVAAALASGEVALIGAQGVVHRLRVHDGWAWGIAASDDGSFVSVGEDGLVARVHANGQPGHVIRPGAGALRSVAPSADHVIVGAQTGEVLALDDTGLIRWRTQAHLGACTALATRGDRWLSGGEDGRVHLWDGLAQIATWTCQDFVRSVGFTRDGDIFYGGYDGRVVLQRL